MLFVNYTPRWIRSQWNTVMWEKMNYNVDSRFTCWNLKKRPKGYQLSCMIKNSHECLKKAREHEIIIYGTKRWRLCCYNILLFIIIITNQPLQMYHLLEFMSTSSLVNAALKYTIDFALIKSNRPVLANFYSHAFWSFHKFSITVWLPQLVKDCLCSLKRFFRIWNLKIVTWCVQFSLYWNSKSRWDILKCLSFKKTNY